MNIYECFVCGAPQEAKTCDRCRSRIRGALSALPEQYVYLSMSRQRLQGGGGDGRSSTRLRAPLPGNEAVLNLLGPAARQGVIDAQDQVGPVPFMEVLWGWSQALSEERALDPVTKNVTAMTTRLTAHLPWICEQPWVADFAEEIHDLVRACQKITMTEPRRELLRGVTCPSCELTALVRYFPGDWAAECRNCPSVRFDRHDYEALVQGQARTLDGVNP
ncbi:hypothetical protein [Streptomyces sp. PanSC9]|uniref:hypothetical protein n=1 Tax=Streptomyces sp. PanSC9 TaxID=1520461 RepID=UPI000F48208B|nr:hypothetical protein [Streptomyces sp. PanSC9]ROP53296.1 hypothetical protein EDD94_2799 [Streptomyces sp. PanSC9]